MAGAVVSALVFGCGARADREAIPAPAAKAPAEAPAPNLPRLSGIRVDPGYLYDMPEYDEDSLRGLVEMVAEEIVAGGFNTVFLYAYSPTFGAYYRTYYPSTSFDQTIGFQNVFPTLTQAFRRRGLRVVAVLPVNDFRQAWADHPSWRVKNADGSDYLPNLETHFLSVGHPAFQEWFKGFLEDFLRTNPNVDGLEALEPGFDLDWTGRVDYNAEVLKEYKARYPKMPKGKSWQVFRAALLTEHLGRFSTLAHRYGKESYLVQSWAVRRNGTLMSNEDIRAGLGLDWDGILNLPQTARPDWVNVELIHQQWRAQYGAKLFAPAWTSHATRAFTAFVAGRARTIVHAEYSEFKSKYGTYAASLAEVQAALAEAPALTEGQDVYGYHLWRALREAAQGR